MQARLTIAAALILPAVMALGLALGLAAAAAGAGTITGQVAARTAGAPPVGATDVLLHSFAKESGDEIGAPLAARSDGDGRFTYTGVDTGNDRGYVVTVQHAGITYSSDLVVFEAGATTATADVAVYEPTDTAQWIWLRQQHVIVTPDPRTGTLRVVEIAIVQNAGDRTFVGADDGAGVETVRLPLPAQAYDVDMSAPLARSSAMRPGQIVYTGPVPPGQTQLMLGYALTYGGGPYTFAKLLPLDTDALDVLVADVGLSARSPQLSDPTTVDAAGTKYVRLTGRGIAAGTVVSIELRPAGSAPSAATIMGSAVPLLGLLALAALTAYLVVVPRLRRPRRAARRSADRRSATIPAADVEDEELVPESDP